MKENNKRERQKKTWLKFRKRLKNWFLWDIFRKQEGGFYSYKSTGTPCSCRGCSGEKYSRKVKHKGLTDE